MDIAMKCVEALCKAYPGQVPFFYTAYKGKYYFSIGDPDIPEEQRITDIHSVDPKTLKVSGNLPLMSLLDDPGFTKALKNGAPIKVKKNEYLEHHGIKGQKWGVRNGPPYPLDAGDHNKVVGKSKKDSDKHGPNDDETRKDGSIAEVAAVTVATATYLAVKKLIIDPARLNAYRKDQYQKDKKRIKVNDAHLSKIADVSKEYSDTNLPKKIEGNHSIEDDMKKVNPLYSDDLPYTTNNCVLCSMTYDMRRRGYDVMARLTEEPMIADTFYKNAYRPPAKEERYPNCKTYDQFEKKVLQDYPEGTRGVCTIAGVMGGHAMAFEIQNGKFILIDAQSNKKFNSVTERLTANNGDSSMVAMYPPQNARITRLDNRSLNLSAFNSVCADYASKSSSDIQKIVHMACGEEFLSHHGILGQKWGIRRYQNDDGTLTEEGKKRYRSKMTDEQYETFKSQRRAVRKDILKVLDKNKPFEVALKKAKVNNSIPVVIARGVRDYIATEAIAHLVLAALSAMPEYRAKKAEEMMKRNSTIKLKDINPEIFRVDDYTIK